MSFPFTSSKYVPNPWNTFEPCTAGGWSSRQQKYTQRMLGRTTETLAHVDSNFICNNQNLNTTKKTLNCGMDKENVLYLTNDVITQLLKTRMPGKLKQMDGTRKNHSEESNPDQ